MAHSFDGALAGLTSALPLPRCRVVRLVGCRHGRAARHGRRVGAEGHHAHTDREGLDSLRKLLCRKSANVAAVVMGRLRDMPTLKVERPELPFLRFLEKPRVYYPGIELVVDAELSTATIRISTTTSSAESVCCPP